MPAKYIASKIPAHRFRHENSARAQSRGINEVFCFPNGIEEDECFRPGVKLLGWNTSRAIGFPDETMLNNNLPERKNVILVKFDDYGQLSEAWFHFNDQSDLIDFAP